MVANANKLRRFLTWRPKFNNLRKMVKSSELLRFNYIKRVWFGEK